MAIARGGVDTVTIGSAASELGVTKGSFYWHFDNREALIAAAIRLWVERSTDAVLVQLDREPSPERRVRKALALGFEHGPSDRVESRCWRA